MDHELLAGARKVDSGWSRDQVNDGREGVHFDEFAYLERPDGLVVGSSYGAGAQHSDQPHHQSISTFSVGARGEHF
jgi:hypothetical protein